MSDKEITGKEITGRQVFIVTASAFALIIGVNVYMAVMAVGTFPGLEVKNSYVASQQFDANRDAQLALGWQVSAKFEDKVLRVSILDDLGNPVDPPQLSALLGRTTQRTDDTTPVFKFDGQAHLAPADLAPGKWELRLDAVADDGTAFRQRIVLFVDAPK